MACERTFVKKSKQYWLKSLGPAFRPVERENHNLSYIFKILALEGLIPSKGLKHKLLQKFKLAAKFA
jgi:hypothetical protein